METLLKGAPGIGGKCAGKAFVVRLNAEPANSHCGERQWRDAMAAVTSELEAQASENEIFAAHLEMIQDPMLEECIATHIEEGKGATEAIECASEEICGMFEQIDDEYLDHIYGILKIMKKKNP